MSELDLGAPDLPPDLRFTDAPPPSGPMDQFAAFGNAVHASYEAQRFDGDMFAKANAQSEAIDLRNAHIQRATGVELENPIEGGYMNEARARGSWLDLVPSTDEAMAVYQEKLDALEQQFPDKAWVIKAKTPILDDARQISDYWSQRAARGEPGLNAVVGLGASFLGSAAGFFRNPVNLGLTLETGAVGGGAASLASVAAREAAVNASLQAVSEPGVQSWRGERGQESGVVPALKEIGEAGLFGAGFGGLLHIGGRMLSQAVDHGEGVSGVLPERPPAAPPASPAAANGVGVPPPSPAEMEQAHVDNLGQAARAEAESGRVAPEVALETAKRVDGDAAQLATMRGAQAEMDATGARGTDAAAEAVSKEMEAQATPQALAAIHGLEEPTPAVPEPRFRREGERAQEAQSEALQAELKSEVEAQAQEAEPGPIEDIAIKPKRAVTRKYPSLFEALADEGGLAPSGELNNIFDKRNPFIPGFGRLIRKGGRTLDDALTAAKELGYLYDPNEHRAAPLTLTTDDLLTLIRDEAHGNKVRTYADQAEMAAAAAQKDRVQYEKAVKQTAKRLQKDLDPYAREWYSDRPEVLENAAAKLVDDPSLSPATARMQAEIEWERSLVERSDQFEQLQKARTDDTEEIPGWDLPADARATPGLREAGARAGEDEARAGPREAGEGSRSGGADDRAGDGESARLLELTPREDGSAAPLAAALKEPTRAEMLAKVVERCPF